MKFLSGFFSDLTSQFQKKRTVNSIVIISACIFIIGILAQFVASFLLTTVLTFFPDTAAEYSKNINGLLQLSLEKMLYVVIWAPVIEEFIFRGIAVSLVKQFCPFFIANVVQAILFGVYHGNLVQGIYAFLLGLFIGYVLYATGSIFYTMLFHSGINLMGLFIENIVPTGTPFFKTLMITLVCLAALVVIWRRMFRIYCNRA